MASSTPWLLLQLLFAVSIITPCLSIYEDQVGMWDWHQQYIGKVNHATFQTQGSGKKRVLVATKQNVLASINLRKGEIFWKHVFGDMDKIDGLDIVLGKYVLTLSKGGTAIRAWHLPDGQLVWETSLESPGTQPKLHISSVNLPKGKLVLVYGDALLHGISSSDGELLWTLKTSENDVNLQKIVDSENKDTIYGVGFSGSSGVSLWDIDAKTGQYKLRKTPKIQGKLSLDKLVITENLAIALDVVSKNIAIASVDEKDEPTLHVFNIEQVVLGGLGKPVLLEEAINGIFALQFDNQIVLLKHSPSNQNLEVVETFEGPSVLSKGIELPNKKSAFSVLQQVEGDKIAVNIILIENGEKKISREIVSLGSQRGRVRYAYLNDYIRNDKSHGFRVLIVTEDDSLSLLQQGEVVWNREEGLACIKEASTAELPLEKEGVTVAQVEHTLIEWLSGHWLKLKATLMLANVEEVAIVQAMRLKSADKTKMSRDHNGFRKLLIVVTEAGKVYALHTGDGRIVWSLLVSGFRSPSPNDEKLKILKLLPWQVPHKHALDENPIFLIVAKYMGEDGPKGKLAWVDASTGSELNSVELSYSVEQIIPLPLTDSSEQRLHLLIDEHRNAHLFPFTDECLQIFLNRVPDTYFYVVDKDEGKITGYVVKETEAVSAISPNDGFFFPSQKLWTVVFPSDSERIITTATRKLDEVVHTQAKVQTNQEVLYKYLNKNTLFVATVAPGGAGAIGDSSPEANWLVVYVIDTVTGHILYRLKHPSMHGPVHAVFSENWLVYHYFNVRAHRFEMSVLEMYDKNRVDNSKVLQVMLGRHNGSSPVTSYSRVELEVKTFSSFFPQSVKALTVTTTARGITGKQILVGSIGDQVIALDKRFLDPRRSPNPSPAEREEGIIPLTESIPIHPQSYLSHRYQIEGLRGIISVPANLESTSLVFAYGVDLFFTHTAPSRMYDSLTDDFSYALLLITIVALLIAIVATWILSERKELNEKWK